MHKNLLVTGYFQCDFQDHKQLFMCVFMVKTVIVGSLNGVNESSFRN